MAAIGAETHRAAEIVAGSAAFDLVAAGPFGHQPDDRLRTGAEFGGPRAGNTRQAARRFDHGHLHAEANSEIGHIVFTCELDRGDLALGAAFAEPAGHQNALDIRQVVDCIL